MQATCQVLDHSFIGQNDCSTVIPCHMYSCATWERVASFYSMFFCLPEVSSHLIKTVLRSKCSHCTLNRYLTPVTKQLLIVVIRAVEFRNNHACFI